LATQPATADIARRIFNDRLDAAVCGGLIILVSMIVIESGMVWVSVITGRKVAETKESAFVATRFTAEEMG
jgi:carbon starvation protein